MSTQKELVVVRFLLKGGTWADVGMEREEADTLVEQWALGGLPPTIVGKSGPTSYGWAVRTEDVSGIQTSPVQPQPQGAQQFGAGPRSGQPMSWRGNK